jgi:Zn-dependent alcohol dehydrogenase
MTFNAAILRAHNEPLELVSLEHEYVDHQGRFCSYGQVRVEVIASGICGAQLMEISGTKNADAPLPRLLGHEGVGIIRETGPGVSVQLLGKKCVLHWRKGDGPEATLPARYRKGLNTLGGGHITTFAQSVVVSANRVTPVPTDTPDELCALLGCGLSTALGTIEQEAKLKMGESLLVVGAGGVGLNLIMAGKLANAFPIHAMEVNPDKFSMARSVGAHLCFQKAEGGKYDVIVDTTGNVGAIESTLPLLSENGRFVCLGQTKPEESFQVLHAVNHYHGNGHRIIWSQGGGFQPSQMIPRYLNLWRSGALNLDGVISHRLPLERINEGLELVRNGQAGRVLISMR